MSQLRLAYNTNGLADHRLQEALAFLADCGYQGVGLTLDHHHIDPFSPDLYQELNTLRRCLDRLGLAVVVETGARFLLDPRRKHEPSMLSQEGRERRIDFLRRAVDIADVLEAEAVSFWTGTAPPAVRAEVAWGRLVDGCAAVLEKAEEREMVLGLEPEPGHLVDRLGLYDELVDELGNPGRLGLTLDIGHCLCVGEDPVASIIESSERLVNVHIEDMRRGVHEHLDFGEGEIDFPPVLDALSRVGYRGLLCAELSRHSHVAHITVPRTIEFLREAERRKVPV